MRILLISFILSSGIVFGQDIPTLVPADPFDPNGDALRLFDAIEGFGTDEDKIVSVLCYRTASQREVITSTYNSQHGSLENDLKFELGGSFQTLSIMLTHSMAKFLSIELHETMSGLGTDERALTEIVMSRTNQELADVRSFYVNCELWAFASLRHREEHMLRLSKANYSNGRGTTGMRDESNLVNMTLVQEDVVALYEAGPAIFGADENVYVNIFSLRSYVHLNEVGILFELTYGMSLATVVTTEFNGDIGYALYSISEYSRDKAMYFSRRFHEALLYETVAGTSDRNMMRLTVSRCETDLGNIKNIYRSMYGVTLHYSVSEATSGSYRTALLALIGT
uniref:Annexin n=1 Tax=Daphnia galeata TaxID=27404 RepID=A0A8J2WF52_9CRUS|nr:unnamed protein product [Daphnia galeata]